MNPDFLALLHRALKADGVVWVATDHAEYFAVMMEVFRASPLFREQTSDLPPTSLTHFEIKYTAQQRPIHRATFKKSPAE